MKTCKHYSPSAFDSFLSCNENYHGESSSGWVKSNISWVITKSLEILSIGSEKHTSHPADYRETNGYQEKQSLYILGIDPGLSGAIALIGFDRLSGAVNFEQVIDIPTKDGKSLEILEFSRIVKSLTKDKNLDQFICCIERVGEMPTKSDPLRAFKFGFTTGAINAVLFLLGLKVSAVKPHIWKSALGLGTDKKQSIEKAKRIFPDAAPFLGRVKDHDRAEALLLAYFLTTMLKTFKPERQ